MHQHFNECDGALSESELARNRVCPAQWATSSCLACSTLSTVQSPPACLAMVAQLFPFDWAKKCVRVERSFFLYLLLFFLSFQRPGHIVWGARTETASSVWSSLATGLCLLRYMLECIRIYGQRWPLCDVDVDEDADAADDDAACGKTWGRWA